MSSVTVPSIEVFWNQTNFSSTALSGNIYPEALCLITEGLGNDTVFSLETAGVPLTLSVNGHSYEFPAKQLADFGLAIGPSPVVYDLTENLNSSGIPRKLWICNLQIEWLDSESMPPLNESDRWCYETTPASVVLRALPDRANCLADTAVNLRLGNRPSFTMFDIDPDLRNPSWLSADTRVFRVLQGSDRAVGSTVPFPNGPLAAGMDPVVWFGQLLDQLHNSTSDVRNAFFEALPLDSADAAVALLPNENGTPVHNFAMARIAADSDDYTPLATHQEVRVFFRLFRTPCTNLSYDADGPAAPVNFPHGGDNLGPLVGRTDSTSGEVVSVPFFAEPRPADWETNPPLDLRNRFQVGSIPMSGRHITGAYLDINQPGSPVAGYFQSQSPTLVVEIIDPCNPIPPCATPTTNGCLSQRNLSVQAVTNPGFPEITRRVEEVFEFVPWTDPRGSSVKAAANTRNPADTSSDGTATPLDIANMDRLLFRAKSLPAGAELEVYMPGVPLASTLPPGGRALAHDRVRLPLEHVAELPVPVSTGTRCPGLLAIQLLPNEDVGREYAVDVLHLHGGARRVVGGFRVRVPVFKARVALEQHLLERQIARQQYEKAAASLRTVLAKRLEFASEKADAVGTELVRDFQLRGQRHSLVLEAVDWNRIKDSQHPIVAEVFDGGRLVSKRVVAPSGPLTLHEGVVVDAWRVRFRDRTGRQIEEQDWPAEPSPRSAEFVFTLSPERAPASPVSKHQEAVASSRVPRR